MPSDRGSPDPSPHALATRLGPDLAPGLFGLGELIGAIRDATRGAWTGRTPPPVLAPVVALLATGDWPPERSRRNARGPNRGRIATGRLEAAAGPRYGRREVVSDGGRAP